MIRTTYILFITSLMLFWGCRKDDTEFIPYGSSIDEIDLFLQSTLDETTENTFSLKGGATVPDTTLVTPGGIRVTLANTDFLFENAQGTLVPLSSCNEIKIQVVAAPDKSAWMANLLPSVNADGLMIDHTGGVFIKVICDGQEMQVADNRYIKVQVPSNSLQNDMSLNYLTINADGSFARWESGESNSVFWGEWPGQQSGSTQTGYEILTHKTGWITASKPLTAVSFSKYCVSLPLQFDHENTRVFLSVDGTGAITEMKTENNPSVFCLNQAPLGYPVRIITITKAGPTYFLGDKETETASDATVRMTPIEKSAAQISSVIQGL